MNWDLLWQGALETLRMVFFSTLFSSLLGLPLGILLYLSQKGGLRERPLLYRILDTLVNVLRSFPFIILIILIFPLSRYVVGRSIGTTAAILPLSIAAAPFVARLCEQSLNELDPGLVEASLAFGASPWQTVSRALLPEALPALVSNLTLTIINLIGYSAMAGAIGGGGLGDLAVRFGLHAKNPLMLWAAVLLILLLVQTVQAAGSYLSRRLSRN